MDNHNNHKETEWLNLLQEGNHVAFNQIYEHYWKRLYNYTYNILQDEGLAEDCLHDVFTNIWVKRSQLEIDNLKSYLFNACRNKAISLMRKVKFSPFQEEVVEQLGYLPEVESKLEMDDIENEIREATRSLPDRCREIFMMSRFEHLTIQEIAVRLNISTRTVENQLATALKHIRPEVSAVLFAALIVTV